MTATSEHAFVPHDIDASDWSQLKPLYEVLIERVLASTRDLEQLLLDRSELDAAASEAAANLYIAMTCQTDNEPAKEAYLAFVDNTAPKLAEAGFELDRKIIASDHAGALEPDRYGVMLRSLAADVEIFREENIPLGTRNTRLAQQFSELTGAMTVSFRGEERTLPQMATFLEETDRETREEAWRLVADRRLQDRDALDDIFEQMVPLRHEIAVNAGFDNFRDYVFTAKHRFDYDTSHCEAFHAAAEEVCVPLYRQLNAERMAALNIKSLRPWDLGVDPLGRSPLRPFEGEEDLVERTSRLFHRMDGRLGHMFDELRDGESLDLASRKGKAPGGYQQNRDRSRKPFIFMNAAGMQGDLETMIHESGHAFHSMLCRDEPLLPYRHAPIEFAEVASMSMELMAYPYLDEFHDEAAAARARRCHLEEIARLIPWVATIDAFQHWLYTNPEHTREERTACWLALDDRFGASLDWSGLQEYRRCGWQRQLHLFEVPFYYIEYGIAQLGALQLWLQSRTDEETALAHYFTSLSLGGSRALPDLFRAADLDFDFGPDTMRRLMDAVAEELAGLPR